jgi:endogenous inhibitor of DNA gyrase (YacG/DUF329 family)
MPPRPDKPKPAQGKHEPNTPARKPRSCPICSKPADQKFRPFCSARCRDVDLHRWLSGSYVVPGSENDEEEER